MSPGGCARELTAALEHYRASIELNPDLAQTRANYGAALDFMGDLDGAREQYEAALRCRDHGDAHRQAHTNLGVLLLVRGERSAAQEHLDAGAKLGGENPVGRLMGLANALPAEDIARRAQLYAAVLQLDPNQLASRFELASILMTRRQFELAAGHFEFLVQRAPNVTSGMIGLATAQAELGRIGEARATLQRALRLAPTDPQALALQARLGGR